MVLCGGLASCTGSFDLRSLEAHHPVLAAYRGHGLGDAAPYFAPVGGAVSAALALFTCRFETDAPVPVALPADASEAERRLLERALDAWEAAGLGVRFELVAARARRDGERLIVIDFVDLPEAGLPASAADTVADCRVPAEVPAAFADVAAETGADPGAADFLPGPPVAAELVFASIHLRRTRRDVLDRPVPLTEEELLGAAVHELGHALGFPGHVRSGDEVMVSHGQVDAARRVGRHVAAGQGIASRALAALYAIPSGTRLGRLVVGRDRVAPLRALDAAARAAGFAGPYVRVGDVGARVSWRTETDTAAIDIAQWAEAVREPARFTSRANLRARRLLTAPLLTAPLLKVPQTGAAPARR